jgi:DNA-binding response OmpR family regulator
MFRRIVPHPSAPAVLLRSAPDKMLPLIPFTPDWAVSSMTGHPAPAADGNALKVVTENNNDLPLILAEADPVTRELICALGEKWGYAVKAANDGLGVMAAISAQEEPALAVINWKMSGMGGIEICRATRELNRPVYIVIVTERSGAEQLDKALEAGADDYLITPFDADELRARLRVGARVISLQSQLADARREAESASAQVQALSAASGLEFSQTSVDAAGDL